MLRACSNHILIFQAEAWGLSAVPGTGLSLEELQDHTPSTRVIIAAGAGTQDVGQSLRVHPVPLESHSSP